MKARTIVLIICLPALFLPAMSAYALTLEEVSNELVCQCGCGLVLNNCNHSDCGVAIPMREIIKQKIGQGETSNQIVSSFVSQYGEVVLSSPTKKGFNLTVWLLPFIGLAVGAGIITVVIILWTKRRRSVVSDQTSKQTKIEGAGSDKYEKIFEQEFQDFD
jgi:cytochrome c-type biogenesis protein CcmH